VIFSDASSRRLLLKILTVLGLYVGVTAIFEVIGPHALVFPRYIMQQQVGISFGRARGPFTSADDDGAVLAAAFFAAFANAAITESRRWKVVSTVSCVLCLAGVFLTLTRSVWIGVSVGVIVAALAHRSTRRALPVVALAIAVAVGGALALSTSLRAKVTDRATTTRSVYDRENTNAAGIRAIEANPLTGVGWLEFTSVSDRYVRQARDYPLTTTDIEIHNVELSRLAELGLIGGSLWILSVLLGPISAVWRARRANSREDRWVWIASIGILVDWLVQIQFSPFPYPLPNNLVWLFCGIVAGLSTAKENGLNGRTKSSTELSVYQQNKVASRG
jgi:putative inorganic carbon (HCO3(-)) transporter